MTTEHDKAVALASQPARYEYQAADGTWHPFLNDKHNENTKADGRWPIRALFTRQQIIEELAQRSEVMPFGYAREWEGDDSDLNNWLFEVNANELDDRPWVSLYAPDAIASLEAQKQQLQADYDRHTAALMHDRDISKAELEQYEARVRELEKREQVLYSAWHAIGADVAGLKWADFVSAIDAAINKESWE